MKRSAAWVLLLLLLLLARGNVSLAAGRLHEVRYEASAAPGELPMPAVFSLWVPDGVKTLRGVIVHQHGCGVGSWKGAVTAAEDLHWQALAKKWDCALLGPSYQMEEKQSCRLWCDPRNGSDKTFLRALDDLADASGHPELKTAPWCLWGHSGGGFWASIMQGLHPERIVAIWFRSGTAYAYWQRGEVEPPPMSQAMFTIPMMCNPGAKENGDKRFNGAWTGTLAMFKDYRAKGAPIGFAPDPLSNHDTGDSRYMAIPFFDACLAMRLPPAGSADQKLRPVDMTRAWLAEPLSHLASPAASYTGDAGESVWLPDERTARAWMEFVATGATSDTTPPPAPVKLSVKSAARGVELTWDAEADFESGLAEFLIERDGEVIGRVPEKPTPRYGRPLFQRKTYGDTPEQPLAQMRYTDTAGSVGASYRVISVNGAGLRSQPASRQ